MSNCRIGQWVVGIAGVMLGAVSLQAGEQIKIAGSTTVKPIVDQAVKTFGKTHADAEFVVGAGGSGQGIKLVGAGNVHIGMASRNLKDAEKVEFPDLVPTKIGLDGIVFVVHGQNPVKSLTTGQAKDIFTGKITNWKEIGGNDAPIVLITSSKKHGTYDGFIEHLGLAGRENADKTYSFKAKDAKDFPPANAAAVDGNKLALAAVVSDLNACSYASFGTAKSMADKGAPIKLLDLDGVQPTQKSIVEGKYTFRRALLVITKGPANGSVKAFIEFLIGEEGQKVVQALDFIPEGT
ncbi:MAG: phosphate ABC transporter substrate-binding protein [Thermoguttaceae bacterium]